MFRYDFGDPVLRNRPLRRALRHRQLRDISVGGGTRSIGHLSRTRGHRGVEHVEQSGHVHTGVELGIARTDGDAVLRGMVADDLGIEFVKYSFDALVANIHVNERRARVDVFPSSSTVLSEIIQDNDMRRRH